MSTARHRAGELEARIGALLAVVVLAVACAPEPVPVRVVGWNIETVGAPDSAQFAAAAAVIRRLDADILAISEVNGAPDLPHLVALADATDYPHILHAPAPPFGPLRTAILSRLPFTDTRVSDAGQLSGDPDANDLTRHLLRVTVTPPGGAPLTVLTLHAKSGTGDDDVFRRVIEARRVAQSLADLDPEADAYVVVGDLNQEPSDLPNPRALIREVPAGLPGAFRIGQDILDALVDGLVGDPFEPLIDPAGPALRVVDAPQTGTDDVYGTRPASGRQLDFGLVSPTLVRGTVGEAFAGDEPGGEARADARVVAEAADHLPIVLDVEVPTECLFEWECEAPLSCYDGRCLELVRQD